MASLVEERMTVGLGSGTTANAFIDSLIVRCKQGLHIRAVSSSVASLERAKKGGITTLSLDDVAKIDLTVDGADEIDPQNRMIKGGGGAHVREKILASNSARVVILVDETKLVPHLGRTKLPVEILPFGAMKTAAKIEQHGFTGAFRRAREELFVTDNGNFIFDIQANMRFESPEAVHNTLIAIPGVVDTGFFFNLATEVYIGYFSGKIESR